ncbi:interleukin-2 receptor subunit beta [Octodon degus]|uniref:Interleukin-2 receptor subunit beta n=1 Tax=Octodon degus TaxID=10160 RepID=A0A6P6ERD1_OCTDE|nr:interleukin-2 receptor subunit beta [Octodon degus]XP_023574836.1 interleukin-2 receptor subunit beta [Octodon degus]
MAAPALSWCLPLLVLLSLTAPLVSAAVKGISQLGCFYDSKANISCLWSREEGLQNTSCHIRAQSDKRSWNQTCPMFTVSPTTSACNLVLGHPDSQELTAVDTITARVVCWQGGQWRLVLTKSFKPFEYLRLVAPTSLQVTYVDTSRCNVTWHLVQISHYIDAHLELEVRKRLQGHSWEATPLNLKQRQQWIFLENLVPDTQYELQVRTWAGRGSHSAWSPWSQALAFTTRPEATRKESLPLIWVLGPALGLGLVSGIIISVYFLVSANCLGPWLKKVLRCRVPDPSEFFSQLKSEHGGDFQKWLSSPFPSSSFNPGPLAPEISPLEVLDKDTKASQLLLLQQDKVPLPSPVPSGHSQTSCFTNQGYFFFHLPDALEIEACQVYFTYDPCAEVEPEEGAPSGSPLAPLMPLSQGDDAYCTFPPGDDLLLFSSLHGSPSVPCVLPGAAGTSEEMLYPSLQDGAPQVWGAPALTSPIPVPLSPVGFQLPLEQALGVTGEEVPAPGPEDGADSPWQGLGRTPASPYTDTDPYLSLQELQAQDPAQMM